MVLPELREVDHLNGKQHEQIILDSFAKLIKPVNSGLVERIVNQGD